MDAQKLFYEHILKADSITEWPFTNDQRKVYSMFYDVTGNAASQSHLYVTGRMENFATDLFIFVQNQNMIPFFQQQYTSKEASNIKNHGILKVE